MTYDRDDGRDVIIEREGTGVGTILGIILAVVVVLAIVWFFFLGGLNNTGTAPDQNQDTTIQLEQPNNPPPAEPVPQY